MTNEMIILTESIKLMNEGIIKGSGIYGTITKADGTKQEIEFPETLHTYTKWKELGFQVQKGQKAKAQFYIWKHTAKKNEETGEELDPKMFMKKASFFTVDQVEAIA